MRPRPSARRFALPEHTPWASGDQTVALSIRMALALTGGTEGEGEGEGARQRDREEGREEGGKWGYKYIKTIIPTNNNNADPSFQDI